VYEKTFSIPYNGLDPRRKMKPGLLLEFLQEAADLHSQTMRMSVDDLRERGLTWVLRRYRINVLHYPGREDLLVRTWYEPVRNLHSVRVFDVTDVRGVPVARAWSGWVLYDKKNGRPLRLDRAAPTAYYEMSDPTGEAVSGDIEPIGEEPASETDYRVRWQELDVNGHANHTVFCNWAFESVPEAVLRTHLPTEIDIVYLNQVTLEDITVRTRQTNTTPPRFTHSIRLKDTPKEAARLTTAWTEAERL